LGYLIVVVEQTEGSVLLSEYQYDNNEKLAVVFGNEVNGVQQQIVNMADLCIEIPQLGTKHSLNVSVSAGIIIWSLFKEFKWK